MQVAEIMLTDVTVNAPPRDAIASPALDALDELDGLEDDGDEADALDELLPEKRPISITWWPTCSARLTLESAISRSSLPRVEPLMLPDDALEDGVLDDGLVDEGLVDDGLLDDGLLDDGLLDDGLLDEGLPACALLGAVELLPELDPPAPNFGLFSTKPPPLAPLALELLALELLDGLVLEVSLDDPPARCRQPVTLVPPAVEPVGDCGVDVVGLCAASVPHSATAVLSVTAHCQ